MAKTPPGAFLRGSECKHTVSKAISLGYRLIDTAQMYGNEAAVGSGIADSGLPRKELFVTTKIYRISNSYEKAVKAIDASLNRLGMDYVDLLLVHEPYKEGPEMYRALEEAYASGKVRAIGISNYDAAWFERFLTQCAIIPAVNQVESHIYYQKWDLQRRMTLHQTVMQAWSPLAQGKERAADHPTLAVIGEQYGKSAAQVALRFLTQRGISVIPKSRHEARLIETTRFSRGQRRFERSGGNETSNKVPVYGSVLAFFHDSLHPRASRGLLIGEQLRSGECPQRHRADRDPEQRI